MKKTHSFDGKNETGKPIKKKSKSKPKKKPPEKITEVKKTIVSGSIYLRETNEKCKQTGRRIVGVVGVIAIPDDFQFENERQYGIIGLARAIIMDEDGIPIGGPQSPGIAIDPTPLPENNYNTQGYNYNQIITAPIWKV